MECFVALLIFGIIVALASGLGMGLSPRGSGRAYQALTRRFGGSYQRSRLFRQPRARFRYGPTWVTIAPGPNRGQTQTTQAQLQWPDGRTDARVDTKATFNGAPRSGVTPDILVGDHEFDRRYHVAGGQEEDVKQLLSDGVRWQIGKLCQFFDCPFLSISIRNGRMIIEKPAQFRRDEDLEQFTQLCLELFDQAMLTRSEGIEFTGNIDEAQPIEDPICQICGEEIFNDMVFCCRCQTPHHLDCWQYAGSCSIYGCRETRFAVPAVAQPLNMPDANDNNSPAEDA